MRLLIHHSAQVRVCHLHCAHSQTCCAESKAASDRIFLESVLITQDVQLSLSAQNSDLINVVFQKKWRLKCSNHSFFVKLSSVDSQQILNQQSDILRKDHRKSLISLKKSPRIIRYFSTVLQ